LWKALDEVEGESRPICPEPQATPPRALSARPVQTQQRQIEPNSYTPAGILAAHEQRVAQMQAEEARRREFIVEDVRPLSWQWPAEWGKPTTAIPVTVQGIKAIWYSFFNGER